MTPEQSAPTIALILSEVINLSAAEVAAAASTHVESARTPSTFLAIKFPELLTSVIANSAAFAMSGVRDSIGPV